MILDVIRHPPSGDQNADLMAITTRINASMEAAISRFPEQWLWSHRRWRRRPEGEPEDGEPRRINGTVLRLGDSPSARNLSSWSTIVRLESRPANQTGGLDPFPCSES
jgi:hypothetical protein